MEEKIFTIRFVDGSEFDCSAIDNHSDIISQYINLCEQSFMLVRSQSYGVMMIPKRNILFISHYENSEVI